MFPRTLCIFGFSAVAALASATPAAAGSCYNYVPECPPAQYIPVLELPEATPIYVVNHGPVYSGPGIVSAPWFYRVRTSTVAYPYIGHSYIYRYPRVERWAQPRVVRYQSRRPRLMVQPPLDPRDK